MPEPQRPQASGTAAADAPPGRGTPGSAAASESAAVANLLRELAAAQDRELEQRSEYEARLAEAHAAVHHLDRKSVV